ncbi:MAG: DUF4411 family protein [Gemmatimonadaceae bacterium]
MAYLLDANIFIQARKLHYGFDFCPAFWEWLDRENKADRVLSIEKVGDELDAGDDDLKDWAAARGAALFLPPDQAMLQSLPRVSTWVSGRPYSPAAVSTFFQLADYYLVGRALAHSDVLVTHEISEPLSKKKVKIPDVCIGLGIKCVTPFEMLRKERARFVLGG